jgi:hypothetical protein
MVGADIGFFTIVNSHEFSDALNDDFEHTEQLINFLLFFAFKFCCKALDFAMNFSISSYTVYNFSVQ